MGKVIRFLLIAAAVLALVASLLILTSKSYQVTITASAAVAVESDSAHAEPTVTESPESVEETVSRVTWYESQGWWGVAVLAIFAALFYGPYHFYSRGRAGLAAIFSLVDVGLTYASGFSIGLFYLPAAALLLLALILMGVERWGAAAPPE